MQSNYNGNIIHTFQGMRHREVGPAVITKTGCKMWFRMNHLHREDGPAIVMENGYSEWWLNNDRISKHVDDIFSSISEWSTFIKEMASEDICAFIWVKIR